MKRVTRSLRMALLAIWVPVMLCEFAAGRSLVLADFVNLDIKQELGCFRPLNPTPILIYFLKTGLIKLADVRVEDSVSCWRLTRSYSINGLAIKAVCSRDTDPLIIAENPGLYFRGPGTAETQFSVFTDLPKSAVVEWAKDSLATHGHYQIERVNGLGFNPLSFATGTFIGCNELSIP
jgi:hypothetical protein